MIAEKLGLVFKTILNENQDKRFFIECTVDIDRMRFIAHLLRYYDTRSCESVILSLQAAENGHWFLDLHGPDTPMNDFDIEIVPPNVLLNLGEFSIPMSDFKQLLQEWGDYQKT